MEDHWRIEQVAAHLDVSANTVRRWIARGELRAVRAGGVRISVVEVRRFTAERAGM